MKKLIMCMGLPGSGKSTWAADQVLNAMRSLTDHADVVVVTKDDIRIELGGWAPDREKQVQAIRDSRISNAFKTGASIVISADTNFARQHKLRLFELAKQHGADFEIKRFVVPVEECIRRDALRPSHLSVGPDVITNMVSQFKLDQDPTWYGADSTQGILRYQHTPGLPWAVMCDLDGTASLFEGRRSPYDATTCDRDEPNMPVLATLRALDICDYRILYTSAREDIYRPQTLTFFKTNGFPHGELFMRDAKDMRKDWVVKAELFEKHIRGKYNVLLVLDDRNQVVDFWRRLGLTVFQVAPGDF